MKERMKLKSFIMKGVYISTYEVCHINIHILSCCGIVYVINKVNTNINIYFLFLFFFSHLISSIM